MDAVHGPVFRCSGAFERGAAGLGLPPVARAVAPDYPARPDAFLRGRGPHLPRSMAAGGGAGGGSATIDGAAVA